MSTVFRNSLRKERAIESAPTRAPLEWHRRLPGYSPSPLIEAPELAHQLGVGKLYIKDESSRLGLPSFKILGASWGVYRALDRHVGGLREWTTLAELNEQLDAHRPLALAAATDGNHGRAVARMARLLGLGARIFVPAGTARARIEGIESEGAICDVVDGTYDDAVARSAQEAGERCLVISDTSWPGYGDVPRWVIEGYSTIFWELEDQLGDHDVDAAVIQLGVGALGAAAAIHWRGDGRRSPFLIGVEPDGAACVLASARAGRIVTVPGPHDSIMAGLNCGTPSIVAWPFVTAGFDAFVAIGDDRARQAMRALAQARVVAGETGAAGVGCLIELFESGAGRKLGLHETSRVVVLCTEGATDPDAYAEIVGSNP
jgi:diaminopropionate ammonia-lyase